MRNRSSPLALVLAIAVCSACGSLPEEPDDGVGPDSSQYTCSEVIGYSQVRQWFADAPEFESTVGSDRWQLRWKGGASVNLWADSSFEGWSAPVVSACRARSNTPDRIVFFISGGLGTDTAAWEREIRAVISQLQSRYPSARQIVLEPVVGGPHHAICRFDTLNVRASANHPVIDVAISRVVAGSVVAGFSPEVDTCTDYQDALGHLTPSAAGRVGARLGAYYASH
jgi:hypothetical protein